MRLTVVPVTLKRANAFILQFHRTHPQARGCVFCLGLALAGELRAVIVVGRPVAQALQDGLTVEALRVCVAAGVPNGCSQLYAAARRGARALGFVRFLTYSLPEEGGASLRAAGFPEPVCTRADTWGRAHRPRPDEPPGAVKWRWSCLLVPARKRAPKIPRRAPA